MLAMAQPSSEKRARDQMQELLGTHHHPKQAKLSFKKISKEEYQAQTAMAAVDHQADKSKEDIKAKQIHELRDEIAKEWGLALQRPAPRASKGGPKPKAEKWTQALHDFLEAIAHGKAMKATIPPPLAPPVGWDPKTMSVEMFMTNALSFVQAAT